LTLSTLCARIITTIIIVQRVIVQIYMYVDTLSLMQLEQ